MYLRCAKLFDRDSRTISLINLLKAANESPDEFVPQAAPRALERWTQQLSKIELVLEALKRARDQNIAHVDAKPLGGSGGITVGEMNRFLEVVRSVFNELSIARAGVGYRWESLETSSEYLTSEVIRVLAEDSEPP